MAGSSYYQQNKERLKAAAKERYWKNRDLILQKDRERRLANPERRNAQQRANYRKNHASRLKWFRDYYKRNPGRKFGLSSEEFRALEVQQEGRCAICKSEPKTKRLSIDHDHETGKVRGLLCNPCNMAIGLFKDCPLRLENAAVYLRGQGRA